MSKKAQKFFVNRLFNYTCLAYIMNIAPCMTSEMHFYAIASLFNHSCDPNAVVSRVAGEVRFIIIRPVKKGEQISISYGYMYGEYFVEGRSHSLPPMRFTCICDVCSAENLGLFWSNDRKLPSSGYKNIQTVNQVINNILIDDASKLNAIHQFLKRHARFHPQKQLWLVMRSYRMLLQLIH